MNICLTLKAGLLALVAPVVLSACQSAQKSKVSVDYYNIYGNSTAALDKEIQRKGPKIKGGRHAVAVARIKIVPNVAFSRIEGGCRVSKAKVAVDARVTLPKWKGRPGASKKLGSAWDSIDRYTRLHEAVHVATAFRYANMIEAELSGLSGQVSCRSLRKQARKIVNKYLTEHDAAQKKFDADEQARFARAAG